MCGIVDKETDLYLQLPFFLFLVSNQPVCKSGSTIILGILIYTLRVCTLVRRKKVVCIFRPEEEENLARGPKLNHDIHFIPTTLEQGPEKRGKIRNTAWRLSSPLGKRGSGSKEYECYTESADSTRPQKNENGRCGPDRYDRVSPLSVGIFFAPVVIRFGISDLILDSQLQKKTSLRYYNSSSEVPILRFSSHGVFCAVPKTTMALHLIEPEEEKPNKREQKGNFYRTFFLRFFFNIQDGFGKFNRTLTFTHTTVSLDFCCGAVEGNQKLHRAPLDQQPRYFNSTTHFKLKVKQK